ncbi:unnamed protein product [Cuscuta campestris]|uniref:Helicase C-terminal domain-containing protein n=1 Tax=Cuscuta campestris TaxID=132261 RepID=A0A484L5J6_9ASTE|nr:unnamed protein product [Cuscuta campestris]
MNDPKNSRVIIFSNFRGSVRDIMNALENIGPSVKATEFIGQSSGKTLKGQSQKVQQAVLEKFRAGGYNVIVATSIGEEGLDIMEVDLVICFDSNLSPLRMTQRMGRTGRKHEGRVDILWSSSLLITNFLLRQECLKWWESDSCHKEGAGQLKEFPLLFPLVLACEGQELKGFLRKQATNKTLGKLMASGGTKAFRFHPSPRMIPHAIRPEVQHVKLLIETFVHRGKKPNDVHPLQIPVLGNKLSDTEIKLLAKYFNNSGESLWRPSLIAFRHLQAFPSRVHRVPHSFRTEMLIDAMQHLEGLSCSSNFEALSEVGTSRALYMGGKAAEPCENGKAEDQPDPYENCEDLDILGCSPEEECEILEDDKYSVPVKTMVVEGMDSENELTGENSHAHLCLFDSELVKVDNLGNVLVSSPQLSTKAAASESKCVGPDAMEVKFPTEDVCHCMDSNDLIHENTMELKGEFADHGERMDEDILVSRLCDVDECQLRFQSERVLQTPVFQVMSKDNRAAKHPEAIITDKTDNLLSEELSNDSKDVEAHSPRLTYFIMSGVVPESPINSPAEREKNVQKLNSEGLVASMLQDKKVNHCGTSGEDGFPSHVTSSTPLQKGEGSRTSMSSHSNSNCIKRTPYAKMSSPSCSKDWLLESQHMSERAGVRNKFRRLRKLGDGCKEISQEYTEKNNVSPQKVVGSCFTSNRAVSRVTRRKHRGEMRQVKDARAFLEVEAEVSSEGLASDEEEEEEDCNSYDGSFIDDQINSPAVDTQANSCRMDMMAIYRRSLLTQSPMELLPKACSYLSPDSLATRSVKAVTTSSSGTMDHRTPQTGLGSTTRKSEVVPYATTSACPLGENRSKTGSQKRKFSSCETSPLPARNLESDFLQQNGAGGSHSPLPVQEHNKIENGNLLDDDDEFFKGIDLDAIEEEAAKMLQHKPQSVSVHNQPISIPVPQNVGISDSPSFDLGF